MSLDTNTPQPSVSERRGRRLAPLQTNFSRPTSQIVNVTSPRPQRPRPSDYDNDKTERVPLQPKRQSSRPSLRNIFSREKSGRKSTDAKLSGIEEVQDPLDKASAEITAPLSPSACTTPPNAVSTANPATSSQSTTPSRLNLYQKQRTKPSEEGQPPAEDVAWKPPPLFQAYPQGLRHVTLPAPVLSGDSIMRLHATFKAKGTSLQEEDQQASQLANEEPSEDSVARKKKLDKEKQKYLRALSDNIEKGEWTRKVYVLATTGYILQYSGEGKYDRLPEKMLLLGPKSVAFASDAIPGKHWVLQVSQGSEEDSGTNSVEIPRPRFSRFGFHRPHARRLAQNFLLVFSDPDQMSAWLLAVRAQIEARGGKKYVSETAYDEGMESQLHTTSSMRQLVKKDPNRFSTVLLQPRQSMVLDTEGSSIGDQSRRSSFISAHRRSVGMQPAPGSRSGSVSTAQTEVISNAEELSRIYSALGSPPRPNGNIVSEATPVTGPSSPTSSNPKKRQSMFLPQMTSSEIAEIPRAQSTVPDSHGRCASPPAPNFSVPVFSRRFASRQDIPQVPQRDDISIDTLSMFSSPPQSPGREMLNLAQVDSRQQHRPVEQPQLQKKQLSSSNSEDVQEDTNQARDRTRISNSHLPEHFTKSSGLSNPPHAAPPTVILSTPTAAARPPQSISDTANTPGRRDQQRKADPHSRPSSIIMSRRKSLNGLTIGPPTAPPPNCPLPKIPTALTRPSPQSAWPDRSPPISPVEDAERTLATISPITAIPSNLPRTTRNVTSRQMKPKV